MSQQLQAFSFQNQSLHVLEGASEPWFLAKDICSILGFDNPRSATKYLDDDERSVISNPTGTGGSKTTIVNEPGLYSLILRSRKPEAKEFKRWITHEVIPAIRRHGAYMTPETAEEVLTNPDNIIKIAQNLKEEQQRRQIAEKQAEELEEHNRELQPKAQYAEEVLSSQSLICTKTIAKQLGTGPEKLNNFLHHEGVIYKEGGMWHPYYRFQGSSLYGYDTYKHVVTNPVTGEDEVRSRQHLKWTEQGRKFIHNLWNSRVRETQETTERA